MDQAEVQNLCVLLCVYFVTSDTECSLPQGLHTLEVDQAEVQNLCVLLYCAPLTQSGVCLGTPHTGGGPG